MTPLTFQGRARPRGGEGLYADRTCSRPPRCCTLGSFSRARNRFDPAPMFVDFFIGRPIFATVCALLIILAGAVAIPTLPIAQFPNLAPPQVIVQSNYIGASAHSVETAVPTPLDHHSNGAQRR